MSAQKEICRGREAKYIQKKSCRRGIGGVNISLNPYVGRDS